MKASRLIASHIVFPALFFLACFAALTWPQITLFSSHFLTDGGDGLQMIWNFWWVNKAVTELHTNPWFTTYLHAPHGVSLLGHTLHPLKGFLALPLYDILSLKQTYNLALISSFVLTGVFTFWLARYIKLNMIASLLAGFVFTFSNYHFIHAQGHMQLVAMEWIPVYILCMLTWFERPTYLKSAGMAAALFLVILCDYYYFFFCVITTVLAAAWFMYRRRCLFLFTRNYLRSGLLFVLIALPTSGLLAGSLAYLSATDPFAGIHAAREFPLDPLSLIIPGGRWRFHELTEWHWSRIPGNINESSVHLGFVVCTLMVLAVVYRKRINNPYTGLLAMLCAFFFMIALGQRLNIMGHEISWLPMPYVLLELLVPPFRMSGVPVRMVTIGLLCGGLLAAAMFHFLWNRLTGFRKFLLAIPLAVLVIEYLPSELPTVQGWYPPHVDVLKEQPDGLVFDDVTSHTHALYHQTIHEKPVAFGYVSREPLSTRKQNQKLHRLFFKKRVDELWRDYGFRYFVVGENVDFNEQYNQSASLLYRGHGAALYDLGPAEQITRE